MATYDTINLISRGSMPAVTLSYAGTECSSSSPFTYPKVLGPAPPTNSKGVYTPSSETKSVSDPTKGTNRNWARIKKSGEISFTNYSASKTKTEEFVVEVPHEFVSWRRGAIACGQEVVATTGLQEARTLYSERIAFANLSPVECFNTTWDSEYSSFSDDLNDAISTTQQAAFAEAMSTYDLLTELAEAGTTLSYMQDLVGGAANALKSFAQTDEQTYKRARGLTAKDLIKSSDKALRRLGSRWLEYRYAIMPLIYSLKDINETLGAKDSVYKTGRSRANVGFQLLDDDFDFPIEGKLYFKTGSVECRVSSMYKARYGRGALQRVLSQTAFNPFKTGWELIPYSFVVDWFLNVGDALTAAYTLDLSTQSIGCTAIKRVENYDIILFDNTVDRSIRTIAAYFDLPELKLRHEYRRNIREPLKRVSVESYKRVVFSRPKPQVVFDPFLNWKRTLDGIALSYQPIKKLLRSL